MAGGMYIICLSTGSVLQTCFFNQMTYINWILLATFSGITSAIQFQDKIVQLGVGHLHCVSLLAVFKVVIVDMSLTICIFSFALML